MAQKLLELMSGIKFPGFKNIYISGSNLTK